MAEELHRLTLRISGRVQGVGFRWFVMRESQRLGLAGYVRNCSDGMVEVVAEGPTVALDRLEASCRRGPPASEVGRVERDAEPDVQRRFSDFEIRSAGT